MTHSHAELPDPEIIAQLERSVTEFKNALGDQYVFRPVATEAGLSGFEQQFGVRVPAEFRWFVLNIANGIINTVPHNFNLIETVRFEGRFAEGDMYNPGLPFELSADLDPDEIEPELEEFSNGTIQLAGYGCGSTSMLVVNGAEWGHVWGDNYASSGEVFPERLPGKDRLRFHEWITDKITRTIERELSYREEARKYEAEKRAELQAVQRNIALWDRIRAWFRQ